MWTSKTFRIDVEYDDILVGVPDSGTRCPVAIAIGRAADAVAEVGIETIMFPGHRVVISTPPDVRDFVNDFDLGKPVEPFSFDLAAVPCIA